MSELQKLALAILVGVSVGVGVCLALGDGVPPFPALDPDARVLWLGDSHLAWSPDTAPWSEGQRMAAPGARTSHVRAAVPALAGSSAAWVVVLAGVNDLLAGASPVDVARGLGDIVDALATTVPDATILVVGVLPGPVVPEAKRRETNSALEGLATEGVVYLEPPLGLETTDGLHLSRVGYEVLGAEVRAAMNHEEGR